MPRKPSQTHPLREIRAAAGLSQNQFAQLLGISAEMLKSIENRRARLSNTLAMKVKFHTGCEIGQQPDGKGGVCYVVFAVSSNSWSPYTKADFEEHRQWLKGANTMNHEGSALAAIRCIDLLFAAAQRRSPATMAAIRSDFEQFVTHVLAQYGLSPFVEGYLREEWEKIDGSIDPEQTARAFGLFPLVQAQRFPSRLERRPAPDDSRPECGRPMENLPCGEPEK